MHAVSNNNQVLHGDQTAREENFYTVNYECSRVIFVVANLVVITFSSLYPEMVGAHIWIKNHRLILIAFLVL